MITKSIVSPNYLFLAFFLALFAVARFDLAKAADLSDLATVVDRTSHRASSHDRTGGNDDNIVSFEPGSKLVMLDAHGPGVITHMWLTVSPFDGHATMLRDLVIRMYWEDLKVPSVEVPLGDFFGLGHGRIYRVHSLPINVGADPRALNCYWPMPFYKHARIELVNVGTRSIRRIYYNIDYELGPIAPNQGLFHAEFRRERNLKPQLLVGNTTGKDNYVILDAKGEGQYVGCFLFVDSAPGGWWGEGDEMMYIDGEKLPSIIGTGTEDYFGEAWGFDGETGFPYYGLPLKDKLKNGWTQTSVYRFHIPDPVRFKKSIRVTIEHGWNKKVANDYSSVAYWYQLQPVTAREPLPTGDDYLTRSHAADTPSKRAQYYWCATRAEPTLRKAGVNARAITTARRATLKGGLLRVDSHSRPVTISVPVSAAGKYRISIKLLPTENGSEVLIGARGMEPKKIKHIGEKGMDVKLGAVEVGKERLVHITAQSSAPFSVDYITVESLKR